MIILRQKEFGFFTPKKDSDELWKKIQDYKEYGDVNLPSKAKSFSSDFKCWLGFIDIEITKKQQFVYSEKDRATYIWIQCLDRVLDNNIIANTDGSSGCFQLIYDETKKSYKVIYGTKSKAQFLSRAINKLFKRKEKFIMNVKLFLMD